MLVTIQKVDNSDLWSAKIDTLPGITEYADNKEEVSKLALSAIMTTAEAIGHEMPGYQDLIRKDIGFLVVEDESH